MNNEQITITTAPLASRRRKRRARAVPKGPPITVQVSGNKSTNNRNRRLRRRAAVKGTKGTAFTAARSIQKCTAEYASAMVNPFAARNTLPCIPDTICVPSNKFMARCRGVFSTGGSGTGFVSFDPFLMVQNDGGNAATSTSYPVIFTNNLFILNNYNTAVAGFLFPNGVVGANSNSPYNGAFVISPGRQLRLVAAGLKITYSGSNFRNQGRVTLYRSQGNTAVPQNTTETIFLQDNYTTVLPISRKSEYVFYVPDDHNFFNYDSITSYDPNLGAQSHRSMVIFISGGDIVDPQAWQFEAVSYFELVGPNLTLSPSASDPEGMGKVMESLPVKNPTSVPSVVQATILNRIYNKLQEAAVSYGGQLLNAGSNYALSQIGRRMEHVTIEDAD